MHDGREKSMSFIFTAITATFNVAEIITAVGEIYLTQYDCIVCFIAFLFLLCGRVPCI